MTLAIFDFDGTISTKDSFEDFIFFTHGFTKTVLGILINSPILVLYLLKIISNEQAKQKIFAHFYGGWEADRFKTLATQYTQKYLPKILRPKALERLAWHKKEGHKIVVVSASFENYLSIWCQNEGIDLIATQVEIKEGNLTGQFASPNCYGDEKVRRINQIFNLKDFSTIYAYGDSRGDLPLKTIATEFHYKPFRTL